MTREKNYQKPTFLQRTPSKAVLGWFMIISVLILVFLNLFSPENRLLRFFAQGGFLWISTSILRTLMYRLDLVYSGYSGILIGCGIVTLPVIGAFIAIWFSWYSTMFLITSYAIMVFIIGYRFKRKRDLGIAKINDTSHPIAPDCEWVIAVSRRFNLTTVDEVYNTVVLPVLSQHGIVLECRFASDVAEDVDYWVTRMNVILEIADIHIIMEHQPSFSTLHEQVHSAIRRKSGSSITLKTLFGYDSSIVKIDPKPFAIHLVESPSRDKFRFNYNLASMHLPLEGNHEDFKRKLNSILTRAKQSKIFGIEPSNNEVFLKMSNSEYESIMEKASKAYSLRHEIAKALASEESTSEYIELIKIIHSEKSEQNRLVKLNKFEEYKLRIRAGEKVIPLSFRETFEIHASYLKESLFQDMPIDESSEVRGFVSLMVWIIINPIALFQTFWIRIANKDNIARFD